MPKSSSPGKIKAFDHQNQIQLYQLEDLNVEFSGIYFYRVKQVDFDGKYTYSKVVSIQNLGENTSKLYPNPAKDRVTISIPQGIEVSGNFDVYNAIGQKITTKKITTENDLTINTNNYQAGMYFINLTIGEFSKTLRFIKE